ncbi:TadE family type IV pilus minor pilin [Actinomycetes bacterium KLBMP 9759]
MTIEAAIALCALMVFLVAAVGVMSAVGASIRCVDAARELARLAARGEPDRGRTVAAQLAPHGATISLATEAERVVAEVSAPPFPPLSVQVGGRAVAAIEPGQP